ncbi:hypothetical protein J31TS4_13850 [Paenibacillus sp. J31TS4]|uniref:hypothetical protein n=1 Tax=Paenibacillus sp. J31TS4 TaxID=2807195 RepID=UPI001AFD985C|nr:hypothetical protein [Paenibacillus sp. J31TS4]GIP38105.1 hypothetical protein J31TS4_13850 [Paenibacillus sp. J31TS4]
MNAQQAARWERRRRIGRTSFIQRYFALGFGTAVALLLTLVEYLTQNTVNGWYFAIRLVVFPIIGGFVGTAVWQSKERGYEEYLQHNRQKPKKKKS